MVRGAGEEDVIEGAGLLADVGALEALAEAGVELGAAEERLAGGADEVVGERDAGGKGFAVDGVVFDAGAEGVEEAAAQISG